MQIWTDRPAEPLGQLLKRSWFPNLHWIHKSASSRLLVSAHTAQQKRKRSHKRGHTDFLMLVLEWRVNYGVMERLFSTGWKVEAPPDISMPVCLKANFTLHAPGTKPSKNLHFNRIPPPVHWLFLESGALLLHPISYFLPWMHNHFCVNYCHCIVISKRGSGEGKEGSWGSGRGVFFNHTLENFCWSLNLVLRIFFFFSASVRCWILLCFVSH